MKLTKEQIKNAIQEHENKIQELQEELKKSSYVTGFERVEEDEIYNYVNSDGDVTNSREDCTSMDDSRFNIANYGSEKRMSLLEKMNRLQRLLYRFSAENGGDEIDWSDKNQEKWFMSYNNIEEKFCIDFQSFILRTGEIYFISEEVAKQALEKFRPLMEEIIKEEQEVKENYLELNSKEKLTSSFKFPIGRRFIIDAEIWEVGVISNDGTDMVYNIQEMNNVETLSSDFTESELSEIILRGSFNE